MSKYGFKLYFYPAVCFLLAAFGSTMAVGMILLFVIAVEQDKAAIKNCMTAFVLSMFSSIVSAALGTASLLYGIPILGSALSYSVGYLKDVVAVAVILLSVSGFKAVCGGRDATVPIASDFVDGAVGLIGTGPGPGGGEAD